jgi:hypothetical protein
MQKLLSFLLLVLTFASAAEDPIARWEKAVGGRDRIGALKAIYREGTLEYAGLQGQIKVWHTSDGRYRKEERVATYSLIETYDGNTGMVQVGPQAPRRMSEAELQQNRSKRFANSNAMFFVFFPGRHKGTRTVESGNTVVFTPEGGIEWRVTLDPQTSLPQEMVHKEGDKTITARFSSYETVDGIKLENEIQRSAGDPSRSAVIRFTKTVINPSIDDSLFSLAETAAH